MGDGPPMMQKGLTICICTSGRPFELDRCLASIQNGTRQPFEIVVSDDSRDDEMQTTIAEVCRRYVNTRYVSGPRRGLCANRNTVIEASRSTHISLLDDDACVGHEFVELAMRILDTSPKAIVSGDVLESGTVLTSPSNPTRWGHFGAVLKDGDRLKNVQLNCNVFPIAAFADAAFDERLVYGYEDTDLCNRLIGCGWKIEHHPELCNSHLPPENRGSRNMLAERERFVVLFRLRSDSSNLRWKGIPWIPLAACHATAVYAKHKKWDWMIRLPLWIVRGTWLSLIGPRPSALKFDLVKRHCTENTIDV